MQCKCIAIFPFFMKELRGTFLPICHFNLDVHMCIYYQSLLMQSTEVGSKEIGHYALQ